jgi:hypothetical protein
MLLPQLTDVNGGIEDVKANLMCHDFWTEFTEFCRISELQARPESSLITPKAKNQDDGSDQ